MGLLSFFKSGNTPLESFADVTEKAINGDADAQFQIAKTLDEKGEYAESIKWLEMAVQNNHNDARYYLALNYFGGIGVRKDYDKVIKLGEELLHIDNDLRGAKILGDLYAKKQVHPSHPLAKYYDVNKAEVYYLMIMRSQNPNCWLSISHSLGWLYGNEYLHEGDFYKHNLSNPMKAVYCLYLSYLDGYEEALSDLHLICKNTGIKVSVEQFAIWQNDYENIRCSI